MTDRPYVRVYHADMIRDYPEIWDDDAALATWLRLLVAADGLWPTPAELPRSAADGPLSALVASGLVMLSGSHRFGVKGMDAERNARRIAASNAAASRWHSGRNAVGNAETMPNRAEPNQTEPNTPLPLPRGRRKNGTSPRQLGENPRANGTSPRQEREAEKRSTAVPQNVQDILQAIQTKGKP